LIRVLLLFGFLAPVTALAASEGGAHGPNWGLLGAAIFNVVVLVALLVRLARRPIHDFLVQRQHGIAQAIEKAEARVRDAEAELERWQARLAGVEGEAREIVQLATEQAEAESQRRLGRADEASARIQREAQALGEREGFRARETLRTEVAELATSLADRLLRERIGADDDRRLVSEYADNIGGTA
jgi:F-type H+-transporting ATPase subunit b